MKFCEFVLKIKSRDFYFIRRRILISSVTSGFDAMNAL